MLVTKLITHFRMGDYTKKIKKGTIGYDEITSGNMSRKIRKSIRNDKDSGISLNLADITCPSISHALGIRLSKI